MNKTVQKIRHCGGSPLYLIAAIAFTVFAVLTILGSTATSAQIETAVKQFLDSQSTLSELGDGLKNAFGAIPLAQVIVGGFNLLLALGMWIHYGNSRSSKLPPSTAGMTLIKALEVILLVARLAVMALALVIVAAAMLGAVSVVQEYLAQLGTTVWIVFGVLIGGIVLAAVLLIVYVGGILRTVKAVRMTLNTGVIMGKVSLFVILANYLIAAVLLVQAVLSPLVLNLIGGICGAASYVLVSVCMGSLRSQMRYIAAEGSESIE